MSVLTNKDKNEIVITCSCGCKNGVHLEVRKSDDKDDDIAFLSLVSDKFYSEQENFFRRFAEKIRRIWYVLRNKEYTYFEVCLKEKDIQEFKDFVSAI